MWFHLILLELDLYQILARYKQFLWCYSPNSRPMPKKGQKAHSNIHSYIPIVVKAHWLFQLTIQELHNQPVPGSICSVIPIMVCICPKQEKSALKCLSKCLNYGQSTPIALYIITRATYIPSCSQIYTISVVLLTKSPPAPKIQKKVHLQY